ncbi:MAG: PHP domain-containing protein [Longimonas sp.]|uniref:PHP domain-containing protein n=1 Tax=Longimonas sp. TaxID=2039626 RepID=UPI0033508DDA
MIYADLHAHTTASDGRLAPDELVAAACDAGIEVLAVTDHDTVAGIEAAQKAAASTSLTVVAGVECTVHFKGHGLHLLGYGIDPNDAALRRHFDDYKTARRTRAQAIVQRLREKCGLSISWEDVTEQVPEEIVARPHIAAALKQAGAVDTVNEAFERYLGDGGPGYVPLPTVDAVAVMHQIQAAGGVASIAHPGHWLPGTVLRGMIKAGLDALECVHPSHDASLEAYYRNRARSHELHVTGGSDFHGPLTEHRYPGRIGLSRRAWERIASACT